MKRKLSQIFVYISADNYLDENPKGEKEYLFYTCTACKTLKIYNLKI